MTIYNLVFEEFFILSISNLNLVKSQLDVVSQQSRTWTYYYGWYLREGLMTVIHTVILVRDI